MRISEKDRKDAEFKFNSLIVHLKKDFDLTLDECVNSILEYRSRNRAEDFAHYLYRTVLKKKGFVFS